MTVTTVNEAPGAYQVSDGVASTGMDTTQPFQGVGVGVQPPPPRHPAPAHQRGRAATPPPPPDLERQARSVAWSVLALVFAPIIGTVVFGVGLIVVLILVGASAGTP